MSSFSSPPSLTFSSRFRRKSSSASTSYSHDNCVYGLDNPVPSSPLLSSSPLLTPLHLARPYEYMEWRENDCCDQRDSDHHSWSRHTRRALPSLMTKFVTSTLWGDAPLPHSPSPLSSGPQTTYSFPQGDSAISDDCEEHDLESMDIHIRETYFATSAERGRWLSSPIPPRLRSRDPLPPRGYSSPIKLPADISPRAKHLCERTRSCSIDKQVPTSSSEEHDDDMHLSSSLPPSSPLSSPLSHLSFLGDDCEDNAIIDSCSNSDGSNLFGATQELSTPCTSPTESTRASILHKVPTVDSPLPLLHSHSHLPHSAISCHPSPLHGHSPKLIDADIRVLDSSDLEADSVLSPLSQFELDLPEPDLLKLPLSDMENKFYPGQHMTTPDMDVDTNRSHDGSPHESLGVSLRTLRANSKRNTKKGREDATGNPKETKKRAAIRPGSPRSDEKKGRGVENHVSNDSEPPRKRSKLSRWRDGCRGKSRRKRDGISKVERRRQSPSLSAVERCDRSSERPSHGDKTSKFATELVPGHAADAEFHESLTGMLIEAFATSRATSMDPGALHVTLTQAHPCLTMKRSKQELLVDIVGVLEAGRIRCGMFEKVDCSREGTRDKAIESRWFYVAEQDEDRERASLISAIMPRQKRNETKKYKQYYYRPLDKISRWDPEDAP